MVPDPCCLLGETDALPISYLKVACILYAPHLYGTCPSDVIRAALNLVQLLSFTSNVKALK